MKRRRKNPKKQSKLARLLASTKRGKERRVSAALKRFVRGNPAVPVAMRKAKALGIRKNKNSVTIRVIKLPKGVAR